MNAEFPITDTLLGISTSFKDVQPLNAQLPIEITPFGMYIFFRLVRPSNVLVGMFIVPSRIPTIGRFPIIFIKVLFMIIDMSLY